MLFITRGYHDRYVITSRWSCLLNDICVVPKQEVEKHSGRDDRHTPILAHCQQAFVARHQVIRISRHRRCQHKIVFLVVRHSTNIVRRDNKLGVIS